MHKCNVMLFAAGLGTRLRPATLKHPKPCLPLLNIPLGYYLFPYFKSISISQMIVNTFHLPEQVHELYQKLNLNISFSDECDFIKGSGGGLKQAEKLFNNNSVPILVCNSDEVLFTTESNFLKKAFEKHLSENAFATLIVMQHPLAGKQFGAIWVNSQGRVVHIGKEAPSEAATPWHFIGLQFLSPEVFKLIEEDKESNIFYDVLIHQLKDKMVQIYSIQADWYETGNLSDYTAAKINIQNKLKTEMHYKAHFSELKIFPQANTSDLV